MEDKMHTLKFKSKTLAPMIEHMKTHKRRKPYTEDHTAMYGLWLVKDHGIYVMAPTDERYDGIVYAQGYSPKVGDDLWDKTHAVSGDDFAEFIPLDYEQMDRLKDGGALTIRLSETQVEISA